MASLGALGVRAKDRVVERRRPVWREPYPTVGVGIVTYNRPHFFEPVVRAAVRHFEGLAELYVYNDGSAPNADYQRIFESLPRRVKVFDAADNRGVAAAKNALLRAMSHLDYMFLLEDDVVPLSPHAVIDYVKASRRSGIEHLSFAHHGALNATGPTGVAGWLEFYPHCVGAYCMYTRRSIATVGYFDETFRNAWEHVEHTHRLAKARLAAPFWRFADVRGSQRLLAELPGAVDSSTIRHDALWRERMLAGLRYWASKDPLDFPLREMLAGLETESTSESPGRWP